MARRKFSEEFKREAVHLITVRGVGAAQAARDLDVHATVLRQWVDAARSKGVKALLGYGKLSPDDEELRRLRREVVKLKAERDTLKMRLPISPRTRSDVRVRSEALMDLAPFGRIALQSPSGQRDQLRCSPEIGR